MEGIFCQNFASSREHWTPCRFASCAKCYRASGPFQFPVSWAFNDESEYYRRRREDEDKYLVARKLIEAEWVDPDTDDDRRRLLTMTAGYMASTYAYSLRGNEGFWVDARRLVDNIQIGKNDSRYGPHVCVSLLGRFKGEDGDRMHVFPLSNITKSGIRVRVWLERVVRTIQEEGKDNCPAFCDKEGFQLTESVVEGVFQPFLEIIQSKECYGDMIPKGINVKESYKCGRSFRRGAENTALNNGVKRSTIAFVHRWGRYETSRGDQPGFSMIEHYAAGEATRPLQLSFSANV